MRRDCRCERMRIRAYLLVALVALWSEACRLAGTEGQGPEFRSQPLMVLVHSPLVGPATWSLLVPELRARQVEAIVPTISTDGEPRPYWRQHVQAVVKSVQGLASDRPVLLVAHSGAGVLLPAIRKAIDDRPIAGYVFIDAIVPENMKSRLDLFESVAAASEFRRAARNGLLPVWREQDLRNAIPDEHVRKQFVSELRPLPLAVYEEPIPVFASWPDAPCAYIQFTPTYEMHAKRAQDAGCAYRHIAGRHFQMLVAPGPVADAIAAVVQGMAAFRAGP